MQLSVLLFSYDAVGIIQSIIIKTRLKLLTKTLNIKIFDSPTEEWAKFVLNNRSRKYEDISNKKCNHDNKYHIVKGPIADDDLALLFRQFSSGLIDVHTLVKAMEYKKLTNHYSFHTNDAIVCLKKVGNYSE